MRSGKQNTDEFLFSTYRPAQDGGVAGGFKGGRRSPVIVCSGIAVNLPDRPVVVGDEIGVHNGVYNRNIHARIPIRVVGREECFHRRDFVHGGDGRGSGSGQCTPRGIGCDISKTLLLQEEAEPPLLWWDWGR